MSIDIFPSVQRGKKYTAVVQALNGVRKKISFGAKGSSDYTLHKNPVRMRNYVRRHAGVIPESVLYLTNPKQIQLQMLTVRHSRREDWDDPATPGFWSRWFLWSFPEKDRALKFIEEEILQNKYTIHVHNRVNNKK